MSDQLGVGKISFESPTPNEGYIRCGLYLFESLNFFVFFFRTANGVTQWWWQVSDPGDPNGTPTSAFGPFTSTASVPEVDFLAKEVEFAVDRFSSPFSAIFEVLNQRSLDGAYRLPSFPLAPQESF
jgi:hypothetical protein